MARRTPTSPPRAAYVLGGNRIPFARAGGPYAHASNQDMLTAALDGLVARYGLQGMRIGEVSAGAVLKHSRDFNLTRESVLGSALSPETPAYDVQMACATGLETVVSLSNKIRLGQLESAIAGGVDTTSDAPIAVSDRLRRQLLDLSRARSAGQKLAALAKIRPKDLAPSAPRTDEPRTHLSMGEHQALTTAQWGITQDAQDEIALASHQRLAAAYDDGFFDDLVTPFRGLTRDANLRADSSLERLAALKPVFGLGLDTPATMTAGNSTPLSDGASTVLLGSADWASAHDLVPLASVVDAEAAAVDFVHGVDGLLMAPTFAVPRLLARNGLSLDDFDLIEIHEAFASTVLTILAAWESEEFGRTRLGLDGAFGSVDRSRLNVHGSSLAAGHPFAATGGRIVATVSKELHRRGPGTRALVSICAAGGLGLTAILEGGLMSSDTYLNLVNSGFTGKVAKQLGLPQPAPLRRFVPGQPLLEGPVLVLGDDDLARLLSADWDLDVHRRANPDLRYSAVVLGLTDLTHPSSLAAPVMELAGVLKKLARGGRVVTVSRSARADDAPAVAAARQGVDGFLRSIAKELRGGATANGLVLGAEVPVTAPSVVGALRFFLSTRSAFVDGQLLAVDSSAGSLPASWERPLEGRVAVVTGAARGIGESIADTLARDGAIVVAVDVPAAGEQLVAVANRVRGTALQLDVTAPDAGARLLEHTLQRHGRIDIVVHNAGITRDKLLANMTPEKWDSVLAVNIASQLAINEALLASAAFTDAPRIVSLASTSGIAGNRGQSNYAASKGGVIGMVRATAPLLSAFGGTANAVAPGFIETEMTARVPAVTRQVARRLNSLQQGGQPVDVAETVAFLASPAAGGIVGQVLRVCGQNLVGQ